MFGSNVYTWDKATGKTTPVDDSLGRMDRALAMDNAFNSDRHVAASKVLPGIYLSTVFLVIDHNHFGGKPILFETMLFVNGQEVSQYTRRYHTAREANEGHHEAMDELYGMLVPSLFNRGSIRRMRVFLRNVFDIAVSSKTASLLLKEAEGKKNSYLLATGG